MKKTLKHHWPFLIVWLALSALSFQGISQIPFHPDESTHIFMSADFELWLTQPLSLGWTEDLIRDPVQRYRAIDAPLTRYLIGLGRMIAGLPPTLADWDWTASWDENLSSGALPSDCLLLAARLAITTLLPITFLLIYLCGIHIQGRSTGLISLLLLSLNGLTQLHARRAMTEGPLLVGLVFLLWTITHPKTRGWLIGAGMAMVLNAKHSGAALIPAGLLAAVWLSPQAVSTPRKKVNNLTQAILTFVLLTFVFNPIFWRLSIQPIEWALQERVSFTAAQASNFAAQSPNIIPKTFGGRLTALVAQLYLLPPSFAEAGNYSAATAETEGNYLEKTGSQVFRGPIWGAIFLILTVFGLILGIMQTRPPWVAKTRARMLLLVSTGLTTLAIIMLIRLPFQRYFFPLLPFASLWSAFGAASLIQILWTATNSTAD